MSMQVFNAIAANLRRQFPSLSDAMILQKATEIYQSWMQASIEAAKVQRQPTFEERQESIRRMREAQNEIAKRRGWDLFGGGN
ncbi:hypothetical protein IFO70_32760 [Phormidium tenue FACHB-886]|nr:hypothetical protein [Phormidium tenue FACHB-886]